MFSSLASLLPSVLHINSNVDLPRQPVNPEETNKEDQENAYGVRTIEPQTISDQDQQNAAKGKEKDAKSASETFIFVRPPPSKTNHPLNLQVQLVPPNIKPPGGVTGNDGDTTTPTSANSANSKYTTDGAPLARTSSSRSSVSYTSTSYGSSTTSFSSFSSTSNARRTIIPLYNLQAHNVMTNVIVDAGTDAKIAKFQKKGIELIDLALLEPVEVWGEGGREKDVRRESMRIVADEMGASVVVNAGGGRGLLSAKPLTTFLQPGGSRPVTPSAASSATSLHSQTSFANSSTHNSTNQMPIPQHPSSQIMAMDQPAQLRSNVALTAADPFPISHSKSVSSSSNNPTPIPCASPTSMSLAMMSPPATPVSGTASGKRNLFNKLFNRKQSGTNLLSPSESGFQVSSGPQFSQQSQPPPIITTTEYNQPESEVSPPPTFASFAFTPRPAAAAGTERSFGSRRDSMKRRSAPPPALTEPPFSNPEFAPSGLDTISDLSPPIEQTTPTQMSVALGAKMTTVSTMPPPTPVMVEVPRERERERGKGHGKNMSLSSITSPLKATLKSRLSSAVLMGGGSQSNSQARSSGSNVDNIPPPSNKKGRDRDRDASPHPSLSSNDRSRSGSSSTNNSVDSHNRIGGGGFTGKGGLAAGGNGEGIGHAPQQVAMTQVQAQSEIMMNLRQQHLQLRPAVLGIQPTFVSSNPSSASTNLNGSPDALSTTENLDHVPGQRALMYVWLVRRWMKKRTWGHGGLSGLGDSAVGFLGDVVGGLKGEKEKGKAKDKERDMDKKKGNGGDYRGGLGAVTAPLMYGGVEVRFEWKRARVGKERGGSKKKTRSRRGRGVTMSSGGAESDGEVDTNITSIRDQTREREGDERSSIRGSDGGVRGPPNTKERLKSEEKKRYRMSTGSLNSITADSEMDGGELEMKKKSSTIGNNQYDDGEDSDPEDSETPWICTLKLRRGAASGAGGSLNPVARNAQPQLPILQTQVLRIKVGTLSPTPHHPKVVAMLKVPFPLPDVEVERMGVVRRPGVIGEGAAPQNSNGSQDSPYHGLVLTAEEIKDVVCSTGLWLVVREGFGGVGRVSRKGDGWRIRG